MKARIFTTTVLIIFALSTYAQSSRRTEQQKGTDTKVADKKETKSENKTDNRKDVKPAAKQSEAGKTTENNRESSSRRDNSNNSNAQRTENRGNQNSAPNNSGTSRRTDSRPTENRGNNTSRSDNRGGNNNRPAENRGSNNSRPSENRGNNSSYRTGDSRRDNHVVVIDNDHQRSRNREYVSMNHSSRRVGMGSRPQSYRPTSVEVRRVNNPYRTPFHAEVVWSVNLNNDFRIFYPEIHYWRYDVGYRIPAIAAYDAMDYVGDVAKIYGRVLEVYYESTADEFYLYFGDYYPYQDFSMIIPGDEARNISRRPEIAFRGADVAATGYVTEMENKPEMLVRSSRQIELY